MKKITIFLITLLLLSGCTIALPEDIESTSSSAPTPTATPTPIPTKTPITYKSDFVQLLHDNIPDASINVITSLEQMNALKEQYYYEKDYAYNEKNAYDYLDKYNKSSFSEDDIVLLAIPVSYQVQPTSYIVDSVVADKNIIEINITRTIPFEVSEGSGEWVVFVELYDIDYVGQEIDVKIVDEQLEGPLPE